MRATNEEVGGRIVTILTRLGETNRLLQSVLGDAARTLSDVEGSLGERIGDLRANVDGLEAASATASARLVTDVAALRGTAETAVRDLGALSAQIEGNVDLLSGTLSRLDRSAGDIERTLDDRRAAIDALTSTLAAKSDEIDALVRGYSAVIERTLERSEQKAREVGTFLEQASRASVDTVAGQFEKMRETAETEAARTTEAMRRAYDEATGETRAAMAGNIERLRESLVAMKAAAEEVRSEVEATREELKRGVFELPREAQEQAERMRRVVGDQIRALGELSEIVSRGGAANDVAQPTRRVASPVAPVLTATAPAVQVAAEMPALRPAQRAALDPIPAPRVAPAPRLELDPPRPAPDTDNRGAGWLRGVLDRVDRVEEDAPRPVRRAPAADPMTTLMAEIVRAVETDTLDDLWNRYRRGERTAFNRRAYTSAGQATFDTVRRRYGREPEFKAAVDRYMDDFERLIRDVARDDVDDSRTRAQLVSDGGKIYAMFAHASGRFEG